MSLPNMSGTGRLTAEPEMRFSASGVAVCTVNLAFNSRKFDKQANEWFDGDVFYVRGTAFKELAEHIVDSLSKGDEVNVAGRLKTDQWEDKSTGEKRSAVSLLIDSIGPNLRYATAKVAKASRSGEGGGFGGQSTPAADPWGGSPAKSESFVDEAPF